MAQPIFVNNNKSMVSNTGQINTRPSDVLTFWDNSTEDDPAPILPKDELKIAQIAFDGMARTFCQG